LKRKQKKKYEREVEVVRHQNGNLRSDIAPPDEKKTSNLYCNMQSQHCQQQYIAVHQTSSLASGR